MKKKKTRTIPFPQANNVDILLGLLLVIDLERGITPSDVELYYELTPRQCSYYLNALCFIALLERHGNRYFLNERSLQIKNAHKPSAMFAEYIIKYPPFDVLAKLSGQKSGKDEKKNAISTFLFDSYNMSKATADRRASCVYSWLEWAERNRVLSK